MKVLPQAIKNGSSRLKPHTYRLGKKPDGVILYSGDIALGTE
jgi:hypothetical protein